MQRLEYQPLAQVNVTSLVDVTLVLLIVFMLTAPLLQEGMEIDLPEAEVKGIDMSSSIVITINEKGEVFLNEGRITLQDLPTAIDAIKLARPQDDVFIRGDSKVNYGIVVRVIGILKGAGIENVGLVARSEELAGEAP